MVNTKKGDLTLNPDDKPQIGVILSPELNAKLRALAEREERSLSTTCRRMLEDGVAKIEAETGEIQVPAEVA